MTTLLEYSKHIKNINIFKKYISKIYPYYTINYITTESKNELSNSVSMEINSILTSLEIENLNTTVLSYVNVDKIIISSIDNYTINSKISSIDYVLISNFKYSNLKAKLNSVSFQSMKNSLEDFTYSIRIVDTTHNLILGEITLNNTSFENNTIENLINVPIEESLLEIHCKLNSPNNFGVLVKSIELIYCRI